LSVHTLFVEVQVFKLPLQPKEMQSLEAELVQLGDCFRLSSTTSYALIICSLQRKDSVA